MMCPNVHEVTFLWHCNFVKPTDVKSAGEVLDMPHYIFTRLVQVRFNLSVSAVERFLSYSARQVSVELAAEDTLGVAFFLTIDNYPSLFQANMSAFDDQFPCGTVIAIREPWMKLSTSKHWAFVRVDSPSDILILGDADPLSQTIVWATTPTWPEHPSTMAGWKEQGNNYYRRKSFLPAAQAWTPTLELEPTNLDLLLNRSMAYQRLTSRWFSAAHADALRVLSVTQSNISKQKAEYRAASAEYMMGQYEL